MADLVIQTKLDDDLKQQFNAGNRIQSVDVQLIRSVGGHVSDAQLDDDLKPLYGIGLDEYKRLACMLQVLRIIEKAKNLTPQPGPVAPNIVLADAAAPPKPAGT